MRDRINMSETISKAGVPFHEEDHINYRTKHPTMGLETKTRGSGSGFPDYVPERVAELLEGMKGEHDAFIANLNAF